MTREVLVVIVAVLVVVLALVGLWVYQLESRYQDQGWDE